MVKLPWSNNIDTDILIPCKFCSKEALSVTGGKYCMSCYRELLTNIILKDYPISGKGITSNE
jgi:3-isopropylmalate dehydratase small subunit